MNNKDLPKQIVSNVFMKMFEKGINIQNPPLNACIILLRNNDAKIEKRFVLEISSSESNAEPYNNYVPQLL